MAAEAAAHAGPMKRLGSNPRLPAPLPMEEAEDEDWSTVAASLARQRQVAHVLTTPDGSSAASAASTGASGGHGPSAAAVAEMRARAETTSARSGVAVASTVSPAALEMRYDGAAWVPASSAAESRLSELMNDFDAIVAAPSPAKPAPSVSDEAGPHPAAASAAPPAPSATSALDEDEDWAVPGGGIAAAPPPAAAAMAAAALAAVRGAGAHRGPTTITLADVAGAAGRSSDGSASTAVAPAATRRGGAGVATRVLPVRPAAADDDDEDWGEPKAAPTILRRQSGRLAMVTEEGDDEEPLTGSATGTGAAAASSARASGDGAPSHGASRRPVAVATFPSLMEEADVASLAQTTAAPAASSVSSAAALDSVIHRLLQAGKGQETALAAAALPALPQPMLTAMAMSHGPLPDSGTGAADIRRMPQGTPSTVTSTLVPVVAPHVAPSSAAAASARYEPSAAEVEAWRTTEAVQHAAWAALPPSTAATWRALKAAPRLPWAYPVADTRITIGAAATEPPQPVSPTPAWRDDAALAAPAPHPRLSPDGLVTTQQRHSPTIAPGTVVLVRQLQPVLHAGPTTDARVTLVPSTLSLPVRLGHRTAPAPVPGRGAGGLSAIAVPIMRDSHSSPFFSLAAAARGAASAMRQRPTAVAAALPSSLTRPGVDARARTLQPAMAGARSTPAAARGGAPAALAASRRRGPAGSQAGVARGGEARRTASAVLPQSAETTVYVRAASRSRVVRPPIVHGLLPPRLPTPPHSRLATSAPPPPPPPALSAGSDGEGGGGEVSLVSPSWSEAAVAARIDALESPDSAAARHVHQLRERRERSRSRERTAPQHRAAVLAVASGPAGVGAGSHSRLGPDEAII